MIRTKATGLIIMLMLVAVMLPAERLHLGVTGGFGVFNGGANESPFGTFVEDTYGRDASEANQWAFTVPYGAFVRYDLASLLDQRLAVGLQSGALLTFQGYAIETAPGTFTGVRIETVEVPLIVNLGIGAADAGRLKVFGGLNIAVFWKAEQYSGSDQLQPSTNGTGTVAEVPIGDGSELGQDINSTMLGFTGGLGFEGYLGPIIFGVDGVIGGNSSTFLPSATEPSDLAADVPAGLLHAVGQSMTVRLVAGLRF